MRKSAFCLIALLLCLLLQACAAPLSEAPIGSDAPVRTLWGKQLQYIQEPVPQLETAPDSGAVAMSPDGRKLLYSAKDGAPFLCDLQTGAVLPMIPGDEATEAVLREYLEYAVMTKLRISNKKDEKYQQQMDSYYADHPELVDPEPERLLELYSRERETCFTAVCFEAARGNDLILSCSELQGVLDCDTGRFYSTGGICYAVSDGKMLVSKDRKEVSLYDMGSGTSTSLDFSFAAPDGRVVMLYGCGLLSDGAVCAIAGGNLNDDLRSCPAVLGVLRPDGTTETYSLGLMMHGDQQKILAPDAQTLLICSIVSKMSNCYLIRRDTGEIRLLGAAADGTGGVTVRSALLAECGPADEIPALPALRKEDGVLWPAGLLSDGQTVLLYCDAAECPLVLFRPRIMESAPLFPGQALPNFQAQGLSGNGYDAWFAPYTSRNVWFRLTVED